MTTIKIMEVFVLIGVPLLLLSSCSDNEPTGNSSGVYLVRVVNSRTDTIAVTIGPADYGTVLPNDTTNYKEVYGGENEVRLNGQVFVGSPVEFGNGLANTCRWTYEFDPGTYGFRLDNCN
jgi:hypothetical protein